MDSSIVVPTENTTKWDVLSWVSPSKPIILRESRQVSVLVVSGRRIGLRCADGEENFVTSSVWSKICPLLTIAEYLT